jgi:hypothetical protein
VKGGAIYIRDQLLPDTRVPTSTGDRNLFLKVSAISQTVYDWEWLNKAIGDTKGGHRRKIVGYFYTVCASLHWDRSGRTPRSEEAPRDEVRAHFGRLLKKTIVPQAVRHARAEGDT